MLQYQLQLLLKDEHSAILLFSGEREKAKIYLTLSAMIVGRFPGVFWDNNTIRGVADTWGEIRSKSLNWDILIRLTTD